MRIIGGKFRSRRVNSVKEPNNCVKENLSGYRPTTDRARETLFNVLNNLIDFEATRCLDLFSGSGAIGFEFISRGAASCDFVENAHKQINNIRKTAEELGCGDQVNIIDENVLGFLKRTGAGAGFYDIIFADPPYSYEFYNEVMQGVLNMSFGIFVLEHAGERAGMFNVNDFDIIEKKIGMTHFTILNKKD
jgi:16S rRNA (guanine966-N2)-methyltransferase